jgi:hypothetical protein
LIGGAKNDTLVDPECVEDDIDAFLIPMRPRCADRNPGHFLAFLFRLASREGAIGGLAPESFAVDRGTQRHDSYSVKVRKAGKCRLKRILSMAKYLHEDGDSGPLGL